MKLRREYWQAAALVAGIAAACWLLYDRSIRGGGPLEWDEAQHALWAQRIAADLRSWDLLSFGYDSYRQVYWPPVISWLLGVFLLVVPGTDALARSFGLTAFSGLALALYGGGRALAGEPRSRHLTGLLCAGAGALAGATLAYAPLVMLDVPAAAMLAASLVCYFRLLRAPRAPDAGWALLGVLVTLTFLTKQNYGVLIACALTLACAIDGEWYRRRASPAAEPLRRGHLVAGATLAVLLAAWFGYPQKIARTVWALTTNTWGPSRGSVEGILFYPRAMPETAGSWFLLTAWIAGALLALRPRQLRDPRLRALVLVVLLQAAFVELSPVKVERHLLAFVPALAMLAAAQARGRLAIALGVLLAAHTVAVVPRLRPVPSTGSALLEAVLGEVRRGGRTLVIGSIDTPAAPSAIDWRLMHQGALSIDAAGSIVSGSEQRFAGTSLARWPAFVQQRLRPLFGRWPGRDGSATLYFGWPLDPEFRVGLEQLPALVDRIRRDRPLDRIVIALPLASAWPFIPGAARTADEIRPLGYADEGQPYSVERVEVRVLRRTSGS